MSTLDQAIETQLKNIELKAGKSRDELKTLLLATGLTKHTELREMIFWLGLKESI